MLSGSVSPRQRHGVERAPMGLRPLAQQLIRPCVRLQLVGVIACRRRLGVDPCGAACRCTVVGCDVAHFMEEHVGQ